MIHRIVLLKLTDEAATDAERAAIAARSREVLPTCRGVVGVDVGLPADARSLKDWDLCLTVKLEHIDDVAPYLSDPPHRSYVDDFLADRVEVIKTWNFEVA